MSITTEQMKQALAQAGVKADKPQSTINTGDVIAKVGSGAVALAEEAIVGSISFIDRVKTRYAYNRAIDKGLIPNPEKPAPTVTVTRRKPA